MESQTIAGRSFIKCFFQPGADMRLAVSQLTSVSQSVIRSMPPGISPPLIITLLGLRRAQSCRSA